MAYDVQPGQAYTPSLQFFDANGSPILSGITGSMTLYAPGSATAVSGPTSLSHQGGGRWGVTFSGSLTTARGTYRWTSSAITGTATLAAQGGTFIVGVGDQWTLREIYTQVRRALRDGWTGTTSGSGSTTTAVCSTFAWGSNNRWLGSELLLFEPQSVTDENPVRVTGFVASTGTFTFTPAITSTISGLDFILGNNEGQGWSHDEVLGQIQTAARRMRLLRPVTDRVSLSVVSNQYLYNLPSDWVRLDGIEYLDYGREDVWLPISNAYIRRGVIGTDGAFGLDSAVGWLQGQALRLRGWAAPQVPEALGGYVAGDGATIRDDAIYELLLMSDKGPDRQRAAAMQPGVLRARAGAALMGMR